MVPWIMGYPEVMLRNKLFNYVAVGIFAVKGFHAKPVRGAVAFG
jgi:hypothetical protein